MSRRTGHRGVGHRLELLKHLAEFKQWLMDHGAVIEETASDHELLRFKTLSDTGVVLCDRHGFLTQWVGPASDAWNAFAGGGNWNAGKPTGRVDGKKRRTMVMRVAERDGWGCVYCDCLLTYETATIEHVVPIAGGGGNKLINLALACEPCNSAAGNLAPAQKIRVAIERRESIRVAKQKAAQ